MCGVRVNVIGRHNIYNALYAAVCGIILGIPEEKIRAGLLNFTPADMRTLNTIFLESKKVKVCTSHPNGSYELVKDNDGYYTLNILDPDKFWSLSRFLVVELK